MVMGKVWAKVKEEEVWPGTGQQPFFTGVSSCTLSSGLVALETPQPVLSLCTRWLGELKRRCNINVAALFYKVS